MEIFCIENEFKNAQQLMKRISWISVNRVLKCVRKISRQHHQQQNVNEREEKKRFIDILR